MNWPIVTVGGIAAVWLAIMITIVVAYELTERRKPPC